MQTPPICDIVANMHHAPGVDGHCASKSHAARYTSRCQMHAGGINGNEARCAPRDHIMMFNVFKAMKLTQQEVPLLASLQFRAPASC